MTSNTSSHSSLRLAHLLLRKRPATQLWLFLVCQWLAVAVVTGILLFTERIAQAVYQESAEMLAADLVVESSRPVQDEWLAEARSRGVGQVQLARMPSMLYRGDQQQLTDISAVTDGYPLRGELTAAMQLDQLLADVAQLSQQLPAPGELWLDEAGAIALGAVPGDMIEVGATTLRFTMVLGDQPGNLLPSFGMSGRALMRYEDLPASQLVAPGSRVLYQWLLAADDDTLSDFRDWLVPVLSEHETLQTPEQGTQTTEQIITRALSFLNLGGAVAVLLAGIAAMIAATCYMAEQVDGMAVMRALGARQRQLVLAYMLQLGCYTLSALVFGYLTGFGVQALAFALIGDWLALPPPTFPASAFVAGFATSMFCLLSFGLPTLLSVARVSPMHVLRSASTAQDNRYGTLLFALGFVLLLYVYSGSWQAMAMVVVGVASLALLVALVAWLLLWAIQRLRATTQVSSESGVMLRALLVGSAAFCRQPAATRLRIIALAVTIALLSVIISLRTSLLETWQASLPDDAPNYFALNIAPEQEQDFADWLEQGRATSQPLYPVARARLLAINGGSFAEAGVSDPGALAELEREMMLTQSSQLPPDNLVLRGQWNDPSYPGLQVSVEQSIASELKIALGDRLHFSFAGQEIITTVTSIRSLDWESMQPNFYFVLLPPAMQSFPYTFMTSFYLPPGEGSPMAQLRGRFPSAIVVDIGAMVERAERILDRVGLAVESVAWGTALAGLLVVMASLQASMLTRMRETTIARALGGTSALLRASLVVELMLNGLVAGAVGVLTAAALVYGFGELVFDTAMLLSTRVAVLMPLVTVLLVLGTGLWLLRPVTRQSPSAIWRQA